MNKLIKLFIIDPFKTIMDFFHDEDLQFQVDLVTVGCSQYIARRISNRCIIHDADDHVRNVLVSSAYRGIMGMEELRGVFEMAPGLFQSPGLIRLKCSTDGFVSWKDILKQMEID